MIDLPEGQFYAITRGLPGSGKSTWARGDVTPSRIRRDRKSRQERALEHARSVRGEGRKDSRGVM